jgi:hypothetical protein
MFDFHHWADWAKREAATLQAQGLQASFTCTEESRASDNPSFFVDVDAADNLGRIVVWSTGDFDLSVHLHLSEEAHPMTELPEQVTDQNFEALFDRFVAAVAND